MLLWSLFRKQRCSISFKTIEVFHEHYCQIRIPIYIFTVFFFIHTIFFVNVKLYVNRYKRIIFQRCKLHWSHSFLMAQLKQSWQYWHSCVTESLWKNYWNVALKVAKRCSLISKPQLSLHYIVFSCSEAAIIIL